MSEPSHINVQIPSNTTDGLAVQEEIVSLMEQHQYTMRDIFAMRLSLEEALTNAIRHGNGSDPNKKVSVSAIIADEKLHVEVQDEGDGFNPEDVPDPTIDDFIDRPCGRGLMLMRAYLDFVTYTDGGRRVIMERARNSPLPLMDD
ncbi:MAG: ATP-binding protein [Fuerstiella sp.]